MTWRSTSEALRVAVLSGGDSPEREVSLASGQAVLRALAEAGHDAQSFDPAAVELAAIPWGEFDVAFIALHGGAGEDGRLQQRLELLRVPYTGSGPAASRLAMSKSASKERFFQAGVPTLPYVLFSAADALDYVTDKVAHLGYPLVVKPDSQGSSLGVGQATSPNDLPDRIATSCLYEPFVLVEPWIEGRELTVALVGRQPLPALEIVTPHEFFDYQAKYHAPDTTYRFDTGLDEATLGEIESATVGAAEAVGARGLVRVDLMLDRTWRPWVLEVNTVPGLTDHSLAPKAAAQYGWGLADLCDWMVREALHFEVRP